MKCLCRLIRYCLSGLNSNIRCIEISREEFIATKDKALNSNIRCIEIDVGIMNNNDAPSWIVTLDVLKFLFPIVQLRFEFSWIVTLDVLKYALVTNNITRVMLNSNIRCIEILVIVNTQYFQLCWIVTLDVLKCWVEMVYQSVIVSWIVTLDVLKSFTSILVITALIVE